MKTNSNLLEGVFVEFCELCGLAEAIVEAALGSCGAFPFPCPHPTWLVAEPAVLGQLSCGFWPPSWQPFRTRPTGQR